MSAQGMRVQGQARGRLLRNSQKGLGDGGRLASGSETEPEAAALGPHGPEAGGRVTARFTSLSQWASLYLGCSMGVVFHFGLGRAALLCAAKQN